MRVIAGLARRLPLVCPEGKDTRPTTDRIKETLFNIIQDDVYGSTFLDLFSGSGGIGIEALSRGAKIAYFVEYSKDALACIRKNLEKTKLNDFAKVLPVEATYGIRKLEALGVQFDIIYMDPPYNKDLERKVLFSLKDSAIIKKDTLIIIEMSLETSTDFIDLDYFSVEKVKNYKTNKHIFLRVR